MDASAGHEMFHITADYGFNERIKGLPSRKWNKKLRVWEARNIKSNAFTLLSWVDEGLLQPHAGVRDVLQEKTLPEQAITRKWNPDFPFKTTPFAKQMSTIERLFAQDRWALFADMGTGKSKMALDIASHHILDGMVDGLLVISRVSIRENWVGEVKKHCPVGNIDTLVLESKKSSTKKAQFLKPPFVVSVGIESLSGRLHGGQVYEALDHIVKQHKVMVVIDESQYIKSPKSNRTKNVVTLGGYCPIRGIMTGTPSPKNILDLYAQYEFLDPDILGYPSFWKFRLAHAVTGGFNGKQILAFRDTDSIMEKTEPYTVRMHRSEVVDLPPLVRKAHMVKMDKEMKKAYTSMKRDKELILNGTEIVPHGEMISVYTKLRGLSSGYVSDDEKNIHWVTPPAKTPKIQELKQIMENTNEKAIIWVNTHAEVGAVAEAMGDTVVPYHGKLPIAEREANIQRFRDDGRLSIVATIPSMQTGLTLTEATLEVFYSMPLSYADFIQAEARAYRIGQDRKVFVLLMVTEGTIDMDILSALMTKKDLHDYVMEKPLGERFIEAEGGIDAPSEMW